MPSTLSPRRYLWRFALALLGFMLIAVVPGSSVPSVVEAYDGCGKLLPSRALAEWDHSVSDAATGALLAVPPSSAVVIGEGALAGTASSAAAASVVGPGATIALGAATFLASFEASCRVADWITGDPAQIPEFVPFEDITYTDPAACTSLVANWGAMASGQVCRQITKTSTPGPNRWFINNVERVRGANIMPAWPDTPAFPSDLYPGLNTDGSDPMGYKRTRYYNCRLDGVRISDTNDNTGQCDAVDPYTANPGDGTTLIKSWCEGNVGDMCGVPPGATLYLTGDLETDLIHAVLPAWPENLTFGWSRVIVTDVQCLSITDVITWARHVSGEYYDSAVSQRIEWPECTNVTDIPIKLIASKVPTGVTLASPGSIPSRYTIQRADAPGDWTTTATAPDWALCLTEGYDCGTPEMEGAFCIWGGFSVASDLCDPAQQAGTTSTNPTAVPRPQTQATISPEPDPTPGVVVTTADPADPEEPPPGTDVVIPIDGGNDTEGIYYEEDTAECWPAGWGWFNPADWVLKPIKCALLWAFVPPGDYLDTWFEDRLEPLGEQFPIAQLLGMIDIGASFADAALNGDGTSDCLVDTFVIEGTDIADDFCIDETGDFFPGWFRSMLVVLLTIPVYVAVLGDSWLLLKS
jgi:hypothetical protein